jgi:hypothetical protein
LLITNVRLIREAENAGALRDGTTTLLGSTVASVAVPPQSPKPDVSNPEKMKAALLAARAKRKGVALPVIDGLLAATALQHNLTVVFRNAGDFTQAQVPVLNPWHQD